MKKEPWPTEDMATRAVDAAAQNSFERYKISAKIEEVWDDLDATVKLQFREVVLPAVWAALTDLPDPRYAAWEEGRAAGLSDGSYESEGYGNIEGLIYPHVNPYPSGI